MKKANFLVKALLIVLSLTMVFQLTACKKGDKNQADAGPQRVEGLLFEKREVANPNIDLLIWYTPKENITETNALYKKEYGGTVNVIEKAWGAKTATISSYATSGIHCAAVILSGNEPRVFGAQGLLDEIPMEKLDKNSKYWDFTQMEAQNSFNGKLYGLCGENPFSPKFGILIYNEKLFNKYGVKTPYEHYKDGTWNYDQFRKTAVDMTMDTDEDGFIDQWGFDAPWAMWQYFANGSLPVTYKDNKYSLNLDDPSIIAGYQMFSDMINVDKSIPNTSNQHYQNFLNKRVAMAQMDITLYSNLFSDGMTHDEAKIAIMPYGDKSNGQYFATTGFYGGGIGSVKGTNNIEATLAWTECYLSVSAEIAQDSPGESITYMYNDEEKQRIKEFNEVLTPFSESGLPGADNANYRTGYPTVCSITSEEIVISIRQGKSVKTVLESHKPTLQGQLDGLNETLAAALK